MKNNEIKVLVLIIMLGLSSCNQLFYRSYNDPTVKMRKNYIFTVIDDKDTLFFSDKAIALGMDLKIRGDKTVVIKGVIRIERRIGGKFQYHRTFYENGKPQEFGQFYRKKKNGFWIYFDENGSVRRFDYWDRGNMIDIE
jgi:hypothetical protein